MDFELTELQTDLAQGVRQLCEGRFALETVRSLENAERVVDRKGWRALGAWLKQYKIPRVHACLEATGPYSLGVALALHDAGHIVSVVNPAQIRDFARSKLGRNKTDKVDSTYIRDYVAACAPPVWTPPSPALRRLCDLRTMRGYVQRAGLCCMDIYLYKSIAYRASPKVRSPKNRDFELVLC